MKKWRELIRTYKMMIFMFDKIRKVNYELKESLENLGKKLRGDD